MKNCFVIIFVLIVNTLAAQTELPANYYTPPMDYPLELSGSFSELRSVNFHAGIDVRVIGRSHRRVYSVGDGYVSRIVVSPTGYGRAIYINHPEGYTSVYAHFDSYNSKISKIVKDIQYEKKSFSIDVNFPKDSIVVKRGEVIGIAGNTGFSFGAHLHFEMRKTENNEIIDPLLFGFKVVDNRAPGFRELKIYAHGESTINNSNRDLIVRTQRRAGADYSIAVTPQVKGAVSFGFEINDKQNSTNPNRLGLKYKKVYVNDELFTHIEFDRLEFSTVRHQLAYIDFAERSKSKKRFQRTWKMPGNESPIYKFTKDNGILYIDEAIHYNILCEIEDIGGNKSTLKFRLRGDVDSLFTVTELQCDSLSRKLQFDMFNVIEGNNFTANIPSSSLFSDVCVKIEELENRFSTFSDLIRIESAEALKDFYELRVNIKNAEDTLKKLQIAIINDKREISAFSTLREGLELKAQIRSFGDFLVISDTVGPVIRAVNIPATGNVKINKELSFTIKDETCGIGSYDGYINGNWVLFEYDLKSDRLFYEIDEKLPTGSSILRLVVSDRCGNESVYEKEIFR